MDIRMRIGSYNWELRCRSASGDETSVADNLDDL